MALGKVSIVLERVYGKGHSMRLHLLRSMWHKTLQPSVHGRGVVGSMETSFSFCYFSFLYIPSFFWTTVTDSNTFETSAEHWKLNRY